MLKLTPDEVRHAGAGTFLGQALEAEAIERLALTGAIPGLLASIEIIFALVLLGKIALILAAFSGVAVYSAVRFLRGYQRWTDTRLSLTQDLIEAMVGHRTRLVQQRPAEWHQSEDQGLYQYLRHSRTLDRAGAILVGAIPRLWLVIAVAALAPSIVHRSSFGLAGADSGPTRWGALGVHGSAQMDQLVCRHCGRLCSVEENRASFPGGCTSRAARRIAGNARRFLL